MLLLLADGFTGLGVRTNRLTVLLGATDGRKLGRVALLDVLHHKHKFLLGDLSVVVGIQLQNKFLELSVRPAHVLCTLSQILTRYLA